MSTAFRDEVAVCVQSALAANGQKLTAADSSRKSAVKKASVPQEFADGQTVA